MKKNTRALLQKSEVEKHLKALSEWRVNQKGAVISKTFVTADFVSALAFAAKITVHAEVLGHHPDLELHYGKVVVNITSHDAGGLTKMDFELASRIDALRP